MKKKYIAPKTMAVVVDEKEFICNMLSNSNADGSQVYSRGRNDDDDDDNLW